MTKIEEGSVTILALASMLALALALILAVEFACVYAQKSMFDNDLNVAREETFSAGFSMQLKNSDDPGGLLCANIVNSLRSNGYTGAITLWFYEATQEEIEASSIHIDNADSIRCIAYQIQLESSYRAVIAPSSWLAGLVVSNQTCASLCPYALHKTYRPNNNRDGFLWRYQVQPGSSSLASLERRGKSEMNARMQEAFQESLTKAEQLLTGEEE